VLTQTPEKYQEVLEAAENLYRQNPDWVTFFREILGVEGTVRKAFPTFDELTTFEQSQQFDKIQKLLVRLREKRSSVDAENEPTRVITVRLPKSMHEYLRTEAHDLRTSMNKLCISKLLQVIGEDMIPNDRVGGSEGGSSAPKSASLPSSSASVPARSHQPTGPASVPFSSSHQTHQSHQPHQGTPPFKPAQSRF
jgi:predicted HicB family RNase H-like nuclease